MQKKVEVHLEIPGREEIHLSVDTDEVGVIKDFCLRGIGNYAFLQELSRARSRFVGKLGEILPPDGDSTSVLLIREAILRAQGRWQLPYLEDELCHCRMVATQKVLQAIWIGAHSAQEVSAQTSASTACGTCRPDVQAILDYVLDSKRSDEPTSA